MSSFNRSILGLVLVLLANAAFAALPLKGRVVDAGSLNSPLGIEGVTVEVFLINSRKLVAESITDASGRYELSVPAPTATKIILSFSKVGYFARPTEQEPVATAEQKTVRLAREAQADEYYQRISHNVMQAKSRSADELQSFYPSILALPSNKKMAVLNALKISDDSVYSDFLKADKAVRAVEDLSGKLGPTTAVQVYPNFSVPGTIRLSGAVSTLGEKANLANEIGKYSGVSGVQNNLKIVPKLPKVKF